MRRKRRQIRLTSTGRRGVRVHQGIPLPQISKAVAAAMHERLPQTRLRLPSTRLRLERLHAYTHVDTRVLAPPLALPPLLPERQRLPLQGNLRLCVLAEHTGAHHEVRSAHVREAPPLLEAAAVG
jgi:hypothetical protein